MAVEIALVTERRYEAVSQQTSYTANIFEEDRLLSEALARHGIATRRVDWSRTDVDWGDFAAVVLRTPWDYFDRFEAFSGWLDSLQTHPCVLNDLGTLRWNIDKHYLADLQAAGVPVVPTVFVEQAESTSLHDAMAQLGSEAVVYKPTVSGAARETYRVRTGEADDHAERFGRLAQERAMMVQPFMPSILERGEVTVVAMEGRPTHGLIKKAKAGDFRVQDDHGGTLHAHVPAADELELTEAALGVRGPTPVYGRVDMVRDETGQARIMELELIEPELWLRLHPPAAEAFAEGIRAAMRG
ncbi:MAG: ATP-grasp domain-containing protein [Nannocystales bacterium]